MARHLDASAFAALTKLLDKVTDKHKTHQDGAALQQIKAFCKQSVENIIWISSVTLHRLKEEHAQVPYAGSPDIFARYNCDCAQRQLCTSLHQHC